MKKIKSANLHAVNDLRYEDTLLADCADDEVLVEVKSCGICGSDLGRVYGSGTYHYPTIIGHEFSGRVAYDPKGLLDGKNVVVFPLIPCFECKNCKKESYATCESYDYYGSRRDGGMTEYINIKRWNILEMPEGLTFDEGAMCEPVSVAHHAVKKLGISSGDNVFITGAGPIGLIAGQWAKAFGAENVYFFDIDRRKIEFAKKLGFSEYTDGIKTDCALEGTGAGAALAKCLDVVNAGGRLVFMGNPGGDISLKREEYWHILRKELKIFGTWNSSYSETENDWRESLSAMSKGEIDVKPLITHRYPLSECNDAFEMMNSKQEFYVKVILNMNTEDDKND